MNPVLLIDDLMSHIEKVVKDYSLEVKGDGTGVPTVYADGAPFTNPQQSNFPLIIVRFMSMKSGIAKVKIIAGAYTMQGQDGWRDVINMLHRIEQSLLKLVTLHKRYILQSPPELVLPEEQPLPYFNGELYTEWRMEEVKKEVDWEALNFG